MYAMEVISDCKMIQEISADKADYPIQMSQLIRQLLDGASELFPLVRRASIMTRVMPNRLSCSSISVGYRWSLGSSKNISLSEFFVLRKLVR